VESKKLFRDGKNKISCVRPVFFRLLFYSFERCDSAAPLTISSFSLAAAKRVQNL